MFAGIIFACLVAVAPMAIAQTATVIYDFEDVWLDPWISHPWEDPQQMTGSFEWTYDVGDFENGSGQILELRLPWWGSDLTDLRFVFDTTSLEVTLEGNYHDLGVDVTLFFVEPLAPDAPSTIDTVRSKFDVEVGISHQGGVISGSVVPQLLGGTTQGVAGTHFRCMNITTAQTVTSTLVGPGWDCSEGFLVLSGDRIRQGVIGPATGGPIGGSVSGMTVRALGCRNLSTGQTVTAKATSTTWNCTAMGLVASTDDRIVQIVVGNAP